MYLGPPKTLALVRSASRRELGDGAADAPLDALGPERDLLLAVALAPLLRTVGVADRHAHDRDRGMHTAERNDAGDATAGPDDHLAADLLADEPVRRADVVLALRRDRRRFQSQAVLPDRSGGLVDDPVVGLPPRLEREVVAGEVELEADHVGSEHAERFLEELLPGLVPLEHAIVSTSMGAGCYAGFKVAALEREPGRWQDEEDGGESGREGDFATRIRGAIGSRTRTSSSASRSS